MQPTFDSPITIEHAFMAPNYSSRHEQLLKKILSALPASQKKAAAFIREFYALSTVTDLESLPTDEAVSIAGACEKFIAKRPRNTDHIEVNAMPSGAKNPARIRVLVLNDDMPFLVDSLSALMLSLGLTIHRVLHPVLGVSRDGKGMRLAHAGNGTPRDESLIYLELSALPDSLTRAQLRREIEETLAHVKAAVSDWPAMRARALSLAESVASAGARKKSDAPDDSNEIRDLLLWLAGNHFVFLGIADYRATRGKLALDANATLGIYRLPAQQTDAIERGHAPCSSGALSVLKGSEFSRVHRHVPLDMIVLSHRDARGTLIGETRMLGLFTSTVYYRETQNIPLIRQKAAGVMRRAGFDPAGHSGKNLKTILEFMPRDELFQMDEELLFQTAMGIVSLDAKPEVKLFVRHDPFGRFVSSMVYVPRERFSTDLRGEIIQMVETAYGAHRSTFYTQLTDSPLARLHILSQTTPKAKAAAVDTKALTEAIRKRTNRWADALREALLAHDTDGSAEARAIQFADAFAPSYINHYSAEQAASDIAQVLRCQTSDGIALDLRPASGTASNLLSLACYTTDLHSELSSIIPLLEHMGCIVIDATPHIITPAAPLKPVLLRDFTLRVEGAEALDLATNKARIEQAIAQIWRREVDNDPLNALVFAASLSAREVTMLRAYSRYLQQLNFPYSQRLIANALTTHAGLTRQLVALFDARFNPTTKQRDAAMNRLVTALEMGLEAVTNLGEDRIIRRIYALIMASLRTNFYQQENGAAKPYLSIKFRSSLVPEMPLPVPYAEIFVTSQRIEGVHLRGGAVARGGLRWSDRPEDFRTEVLSLMKTQMVKNAVIVPQGAKGCFILRQAPSEREALQAEGIACYQTFLRGLLDITDNIVNGKLTPPPLTVRHDDDDPYLVVAADKGTASFSDIANGISAQYGFWLGDAFASGGSVGYDHKAMAITARGGWVAVERHFREMGKDIARETFTATGIGDMSGDVFGNGAMLSKNMCLIAAFNHRHIFIDPTPNPATSYAERVRLFNLPRSGWNDYNAKLISKGGGVFERSAKSITLTNEMRACLGTEAKTATPDELIRIILKAPVDLLWNGGIGTYVKASHESHEHAGDRTNNAVRIDGNQLRARIVGEGGNLGFTQAGRIEYARSGGRINTDAIDNSGGVDCSDHEVNIKIALGAAVAAKRLTVKARDALLKKMTDEVAELVLIDNQLQTQAISIAQGQGTALLEPASQLMTQLESEKFLNRTVECLPDSKQLAELRSAKLGLTRPQIAVLLAYAKMAFFRDLVDSPLLDAPYFEDDLLRYFPKVMAKDFSRDIKSHRLRREIVATRITNSIVNRTGFAMAASLMRATGLSAADVAQAYIATRDAFALRALWKEIENLDGVVSASMQSELFVRVNQFIEHSCRWFLHHTPQPMAIDAVMARYAPAIDQMKTHARAMMSDSAARAFAQTVEALVARKVPHALAERMAMLEVMTAACDIADAAHTSKLPIAKVGRIYFEIGAVLKLGWLRTSAGELVAENYWQQLAVKSVAVELYQAQRRLCLSVIGRYGKQADASAAWQTAQRAPLARYDAFIADLRAQPALDYPMLIVALRQVQSVTSL